MVDDTTLRDVKPSMTVANNTYSPAMFNDKPENVATPLLAETLQVPLNAPSPLDLARPTTAVDDDTVLPPASTIVTTGCVVNATPPVPPDGWVLNSSALAAPTPTVNVPESPLRPLDVALNT